MSTARRTKSSLRPIVRHLVVQRSRAYVKESQKREAGRPGAVPLPRGSARGRLRLLSPAARLLNLVEQSFDRKNPSSASPSTTLRSTAAPAKDQAAEFDRGRLKQVVALIRTGFLKRLESSTPAFEASCKPLRQASAFVTRHAAEDGDKRRLKQWKDRHADLLDHIAAARASGGTTTRLTPARTSSPPKC